MIVHFRGCNWFNKVNPFVEPWTLYRDWMKFWSDGGQLADSPLTNITRTDLNNYKTSNIYIHISVVSRSSSD